MEHQQIETNAQIPTNALVLSKKFISCAEHSLCYRLLAAAGKQEDTALWISVADGTEEAFAFVGGALDRAIGYFERLIAGAVTPCSLGEIVEDLLWLDSRC